MARYVVLLRAINLGATRKVPMARLREVLVDAGFDDVATYLQSGNVVVSSEDDPATVARRVRDAVEAEWDFEAPVLVRTREELDAVLAAAPLADVADDPKRHQVTFFDAPLDPSAFEQLDRSSWGESTFAVDGRELHTWTPAGIHADRMLRDLARAHAGRDGTARNWRTLEQLARMASA